MVGRGRARQAEAPARRTPTPPVGLAEAARWAAGAMSDWIAMSRRAWLAFTAMSLIWGLPYLLIRIAVRDGVTPPALAWGRVFLAAVVLLVLAWRAGSLAGVKRHWHWLLAYAVAEVAIPFPMLAAGEEHVSSSLAAIVIATVPLIGAMLALRFDHTEKPTPIRALGLIVGFGGVVALVGLDVAGRSRELIGTGEILLAAIGYAVGPMLIKHRLAGLDPRTLVGASLGMAAVLLAPTVALDPPHRLPGAGALGAVVVLGLLCTAAAFVIFTILIREAGTSRATVITYINPLIAVGLGVALLSERPGTGAVAGLLLILAGSWLSTDTRLPPGFAAWAGRRKRSAPWAEDEAKSLTVQSAVVSRPQVPRGTATAVGCEEGASGHASG